MKQQRLFSIMLSGVILLLVLAACDTVEQSVNQNARVSGRVAESDLRTANRTLSDGKADKLWVVPIYYLSDYKGTSIHQNSLLKSKILDLNADGSFAFTYGDDASVEGVPHIEAFEEPVPNNDEGIVFSNQALLVLIDSTKFVRTGIEDRKDAIVSFAGLNAATASSEQNLNEKLIGLPLARIKSSKELLMGEIKKEASGNESKSETSLITEADKFDMTTTSLKLLASTDSTMKDLQNLYVNASTPSLDPSTWPRDNGNNYEIMVEFYWAWEKALAMQAVTLANPGNPEPSERGKSELVNKDKLGTVVDFFANGRMQYTGYNPFVRRINGGLSSHYLFAPSNVYNGKGLMFSSTVGINVDPDSATFGTGGGGSVAAGYKYPRDWNIGASSASGTGSERIFSKESPVTLGWWNLKEGDTAKAAFNLDVKNIFFDAKTRMAFPVINLLTSTEQINAEWLLYPHNPDPVPSGNHDLHISLVTGMVVSFYIWDPFTEAYRKISDADELGQTLKTFHAGIELQYTNDTSTTVTGERKSFKLSMDNQVAGDFTVDFALNRLFIEVPNSPAQFSPIWVPPVYSHVYKKDGVQKNGIPDGNRLRDITIHSPSGKFIYMTDAFTYDN